MKRLLSSGLNRNQLKLIAVTAMLCDHLAWLYLDFFSPLAQILHIIGRITIPIMCFFIAEGYRHTHSLKKYIARMFFFAVLSILPFYLFFGKMYGYRQNIIYDLFLGLLLLTFLNHPSLTKRLKMLLTILLFLFSIISGGWPVIPMLYILIFYYGTTWKKKTFWFLLTTGIMVIGICIFTLLDPYCDFYSFGLVWYEKFYLLGFILALPLLWLYNGKKGELFQKGYFFYLFYPIHFLILWIMSIYGSDWYETYLFLHLLIMFTVLIFGAVVLSARPSRTQTANVCFIMCVIFYMLGYYIERRTGNIDVMYAAIKIEYVGWCGFIFSYSWFISEYTCIKQPKWFYLFQALTVTAILASVFSIGTNSLFYKSAWLEYSTGHASFAMKPGVMFFVAYAYLMIIFLWSTILCVIKLKQCNGIQRKRYHYLICGSFCPWITVIIKATGITGGYDCLSLGVLGILIFFSIALFKYNYLNSVRLASENAITLGHEGILVIDSNYEITYLNNAMQREFPELKEHELITANERFRSIFLDGQKQLTQNERIYEMRLEPLYEHDILQGYMLWAIDMTDHYENLECMRIIAETDTLTGLNNRTFFTDHMEQNLKNCYPGAMFMMDMDGFKSVNDTYGHEMGDRVLKTFGALLKEKFLLFHQINDTGESILCRLGGDEFCAYLCTLQQPELLQNIADDIMNSFHEQLTEQKLPNGPTISIGISIYDGSYEIDLSTLFNQADKAQYLAKSMGKNRCCFYQKQ